MNFVYDNIRKVYSGLENHLCGLWIRYKIIPGKALINRIFILTLFLSFIAIGTYHGLFTPGSILNFQYEVYKENEGIQWETLSKTNANTNLSLAGNISTKTNNISTLKNVFGDTCSQNASLQGYNQKVISYNFKNTIPGYSLGLNQIMENVTILYPGWKVRIYASGKDISYLRTIMKERDFVFYCNIEALPPPLNDTVKTIPVSMWRFSPLGDPQVDVAIFRDTDSDILQREVDAVSEWLKSNKSLHIMRDHPLHGVRILAGMWGMKMTSGNRKLLRELRDKMFSLAKGNKNITIDQPHLKNVIWPAFANDSITHDSYICRSFSLSSPFPTQRDKRKRYIGGTVYRNNFNMFSSEVPSKCPVNCRPKNHQDWEYC